MVASKNDITFYICWMQDKTLLNKRNNLVRSNSWFCKKFLRYLISVYLHDETCLFNVICRIDLSYWFLIKWNGYEMKI